ncbi:MAG: 3-dehydroquinate synthase [Prevotellaceae bacterium]|jgi:3-dehydroquinate synthase|nr:3-dehydroquinate synthase [Prevotellaceae bacterium]
MKKIMVHGTDKDSTLLIGGEFRNINSYLPKAKVIVITDEHIRELYPSYFTEDEAIVIGCGESIKNLDTVAAIYSQLTHKEADRSTFILGVGGGVVCDITGFVASTYMRGMRFGFVPTTLLAQVDASVGGKNGVNFGGFKNRIGTFNQPDFVLCDTSFFNTLPEREIYSGMAEVIKSALIADAGMFGYIETHVNEILTRQPAVMEHLIASSLTIKAAIVSRDEKEHGERRKLNFGHTIGHAIEQQTKLTHGESVSIGMAVAAKLSEQSGLLSPASVEHIISMLQRVQLPVIPPLSADKIIHALSGDKKKEGDVLHFVLLNDIGHAVVKEIAMAQLRELLTDILQKTF